MRVILTAIDPKGKVAFEKRLDVGRNYTIEVRVEGKTA